jgi:hypothetical protein
MPFARAWWRGSAWALAATLVVPGALAIAIATIALGGGLRGLGSAGQVFSGPAVPESRLADDRRTERESVVRPATLPTVPGARAETTGGVAPSGAGGTAPRREGSGGGGGGGTPSGATPTASAPAPPASAPPSSGGGGSPPAGSPPPQNQPQPQPNPVRETGEAVAGTAGTLPAPAGPAAQDAVTTVLDIVAPRQAPIQAP